MSLIFRIGFVTLLSLLLGTSLFLTLQSRTMVDMATGDICLTSAQAWPLREGFERSGATFKTIPTEPGTTVLTPMSGSTDAKTVTIPMTPTRTGLLLVHVFGLALGLGAALFMDLWIVSRLYHASFSRNDLTLLDFGSRLVTLGLALLWVSGLGFLLFYYAYAPGALSNQKIWGKMAVVTLLSLNGVLIHRMLLPWLAARTGRPLLDGADLRTASLMIGTAAISVSGWLFAASLGLIKAFNFAFTTGEFIFGYLVILATLFCVGLLLHQLLVIFATRSRPFSAYFPS